MVKRNIIAVIFEMLFVALYVVCMMCNQQPNDLQWFNLGLWIISCIVPSKWIADKICNVPTEHTTKYSFTKWTLYIGFTTLYVAVRNYIGRSYGFDDYSANSWSGWLEIFVVAFIVISFVEWIMNKTNKN